MCSRASTKSELFTLGSRSGTIQAFFDDLENVSNSDFVGFFAPSSSRTRSGVLEEKCNVKKSATGFLSLPSQRGSCYFDDSVFQECTSVTDTISPKRQGTTKLPVIEEHNKPIKEEKKPAAKKQESVKKEEVVEKQENEERDFKKTFLDLAAVLAFFALAFAQQIVALPFRFSSSKKYLSKLLEHTAGYMMYFYCVVISGVLDDTCYGADLKTFKTYDDFTATLSKGRRRDIKTSVKKAEDILAGKGVLNVHYAVGEWKFGFEHVKIIWEHCIRSMSCADKAEMNGLPWWATCPFCFVFELMMVMVFPMEITELRKNYTFELVGLSTYCAAGAMYFHPNYAINDDCARDGLYQLFGQEAVRRAIENKCDYVNMLPTCGSAKAALGLKPLPHEALNSCFGAESSCDSKTTTTLECSSDIAVKQAVSDFKFILVVYAVVFLLTYFYTEGSNDISGYLYSDEFAFSALKQERDYPTEF
jgi:hypothetical protein